MPHKVIMLCLCCLFYSDTLRAGFALQLTPASAQEHSISLEPYFSYLYDAEGQLSIDDIRLSQVNWQPLNTIKDGYFGISHGAVWLTMEVYTVLPYAHVGIIDFQYAYLDYVYFYIERDGIITELGAGRKIPVEEWPILSRKIVFPLDLNAEEKVRLYIRMASESPLIVTANLMSRYAYSSSDRQGIVILSMYLGMVLALAIYNFLLALVIRRTQFLLYSGYIISFGLAISVMTGLAPLLFSDLDRIPARFVPFMFCLSVSISLFFSREFLSVKRYSRRLDNYTKVLGCLGLLTTFSVLFIDVQKTIIVVSIQSLITMIFLIGLSAHAAIKDIFAAKIFFCAWLVVFISVIILTLRNYGYYPSNFLGIFSVQIGSSIQMMILAFALAARFNEMRRKKDIAQKNLLKALKEQESILENRVLQRTNELQMATNALERLATEDSLTGLLNRRGLEMRYTQLEKMAKRLSMPIVVALIDLDDFKPVNDNYGHEAGDELLCVISQRLVRGLRDTDAVGRLGGDEFVYISVGHYNDAQLLAITDRIRQEISMPVEVQTYVEVQVGASIGVCYSTVRNESFQSLLRCADDAMYQVKHNGKHGVSIINKVHS